MRDSSETALTSIQQVALVFLRTLIGWHFLYEGYCKVFTLMGPAWSSLGKPMGTWSSREYLANAVSGPFASLFQGLIDSKRLEWLDPIVAVGLLLVGLSLIVGFLTQLGCSGAMAFLTLFYLSAIPLQGVRESGAEGTYLLVNKNLIEWAGVFLLLQFRTGEIAGLDRFWRRRAAVADAVA